MKNLFYLYLFTCSLNGFTQTIAFDSLQVANNGLDAQILENIKIYKRDSINFVFVRVYDSLNFYNNRCTFVIEKDSCSTRFALDLRHDYTISYVHISDVKYRSYATQPCISILPEIESNLRLFKNHFKTNTPMLPDFKNNDCTFYGQINGEYLLEIFQIEFLNTFHSGMLYDTICSNLGVSCESY
jgi:hypothetical protein